MVGNKELNRIGGPAGGDPRSPAAAANDRSVGGPDGLRRGEEDQVLAEIAAVLRGMRYGSVLVIVQDGKVIQIDKTEKTRLAWADHEPPCRGGGFLATTRHPRGS